MRTALVLLLPVVFAACADGRGGEPPSADVVILRDERFLPAQLVVDAGTTLTWQWDDGRVRHDVVGEGFRSPVMSKGRFTHRFDAPGTYDYLCTLHPRMRGRVTVR